MEERENYFNLSTCRHNSLKRNRLRSLREIKCQENIKAFIQIGKVVRGKRYIFSKRKRLFFGA